MPCLPFFTKNKKLNLSNFVAFSLVLIGLYLLSDKVVMPVVYSYAGDQNASPVINPVQDMQLSYTQPVTQGFGEFTFDELTSQAQKHLSTDILTNATDLDHDSEQQKSIAGYFYLSIPKLEIYDAIVQIDSVDMDPRQYLGHFKGSCLPGDGCNSFIYGHSTFKYFKNRYKEGDYSGVFSSLDELTFGDEFIIKYNGETYNYVVDFTKIQDPLEVDPLGNPYPSNIGKHQSTVELFTCTPAGTTKYRLSVIGKLIN